MIQMSGQTIQKPVQSSMLMYLLGKGTPLPAVPPHTPYDDNVVAVG